MRKIANNTLVYVYMVSYEHMIDITIVCMVCVMVIETALHLVMANWIAWLTVGLVVQKSVSFAKRSRSNIRFLQGSRPANFGKLVLLLCLKSHRRQMKFLHKCNNVSNWLCYYRLSFTGTLICLLDAVASW